MALHTEVSLKGKLIHQSQDTTGLFVPLLVSLPLMALFHCVMILCGIFH
jgi:hypothetical protein